MTNLDLQLTECDWLCVGFRTSLDEQLQLIAVCRRFDGRVMLHGGDVMVLEFCAYPNVIEEVLTCLPRERATHFWRSGTTTIRRTKDSTSGN